MVSSGEAVSYDSDSKPTINPSFAAAIRSEGCETRRLGQSEPVKYWETIADRLHAERWSYGTAASTAFFIASMRTVMENDSSLRPMTC